ncbi:MAG TPA: SDR family NAD(P)-dependent oxidoreductase [Casimicrobiaceae bacterium]|jgi:NAD(P)-dependent dehydrogenase (short-subunit alcohol dehydrogenase family)|nr:SDR family NAD(P)-dependent oxidoreductase [Casimicrobiaceae bacterium]HXU66768.1 SDR family NAD(P)-dependent oxidoreductase [Casimicrobiaceae bacterium]
MMDKQPAMHAIITGVSQGLGEALALELLQRGVHVLGIGRTSSPRLAHANYRFLRRDLAEVAMLPATLEPAFAAIAGERPSHVCLVNNAATLDPVGVLGTGEADHIVTSMAVNLVAPIVLASEFCRVFADDSVERRIINVSSGAAQSVIAGESLYCVAKAGLEMLTRTLAAEHDSPRFRAISLRPGIMDTQMQSFARTRSKERLPSVDMFKGFHAGRQLVAPDVVARKVADRLVFGTVEQGRTYSYAEL